MTKPSDRLPPAATNARDARTGDGSKEDAILTALAELADTLAVVSKYQTARSEVDPDQLEEG